MKIAMITPRYEKDIRGGGERSCKLLVDTLRKQGIDVDVFSGDELFPTEKDTWKLNIKMYRVVKKLLNDYEVFHTYNMSLLPAVGLLTKKYNINSIASLNGHVFSPTFATELSDCPAREHLTNSILLKTLFRYITKFSVLSEFYKETWVKDGIPQGKIQVIPNMLAEDYKAKDVVHTNTVNILCVGNYAKWRNLNMLLEAYSNLPNQNICLSVVGQGWEKEIMNYKGKNTVVYYRKMNHTQLRDLYALADIYVQPYQHSGIGRTMLEAAQNKTAIVTTGRLQDFPYLHNFINYFANSDMLQLTLQTLIKNKDLRDDQGEQIYRIVNKYFSPEVIVKQYIKLYEEILK